MRNTFYICQDLHVFTADGRGIWLHDGAVEEKQIRETIVACQNMMPSSQGKMKVLTAVNSLQYGIYGIYIYIPYMRWWAPPYIPYHRIYGTIYSVYKNKHMYMVHGDLTRPSIFYCKVCFIIASSPHLISQPRAQ